MSKKVAGYRKMLGKTQKNMAKALSISTTSYFNKEHGFTPFTDKEKIVFKEMVKEIVPDINIDKIFF